MTANEPTAGTWKRVSNFVNLSMPCIIVRDTARIAASGSANWNFQNNNDSGDFS